MTDTNLPAPDFIKKVPEGDDKERSVCTRCGFIDYQNPKLVVGSVVAHEEKILLCKRAIEPRKGFWTLPAGFMELAETVEEAARREAREEAGADLTLTHMLAYYSVPHISQVQIMFCATLNNPDTIAAGLESAEIGLFSWTDIPWTELAFPSVYWALKQFDEVRGQESFAPFTNPPSGL